MYKFRVAFADWHNKDQAHVDFLMLLHFFKDRWPSSKNVDKHEFFCTIMRWNHLGPDVKLRAYKTAVQNNKYFELFENTDFESKTWKKRLI